MKLFILDVDQLTSAYHSGGGLIVVAKNIKRAKEIVDGMYSTNPTQDEWDSATIYDLYGDYEEETYIFPDAGCC